MFTMFPMEMYIFTIFQKGSVGSQHEVSFSFAVMLLFFKFQFKVFQLYY